MEIISDTQSTAEAIIEEHLSANRNQNEKMAAEELQEGKLDPWLTKPYEGKPLSVKSLTLKCNMNKGYNANSAYYDHRMNRWIDNMELTHPYIPIKAAHINPKSLKETSKSINLKVMADTGAMCSIFTFEAIRDLGVEPLGLRTCDVSIVGVGGKALDGIVREICLKITNKKTGSTLYEKCYVSPDVTKSIVSKDWLYRLGLLDPNLFLNES